MRDEFGSSNGMRPEGMRHRSRPFDQQLDEPVDLVAVQADDELINALGAGMAVSAPGFGGYDADDHVAAILAAWRAEVESEPLPELVDIDTAIATIQKAARPRSRGIRHLAPVAAAAAFVVLAMGGLSVGSYNAQPGDALWGVSKVLYSERADSVEAAARVQDRIDNAKKALLNGDPALAAQELAEAEEDLGAIRPEEGQEELSEVQDFLAAKADETEPGESADLDAPLKTDPKRKVPASAGHKPDPKDPGTSTENPSGPDPSSGSGGQQDPAKNPTNDPRRLNAPEGPDSTSSPTKEPAPTTSPTTGADPSATSEGKPSTPTSTTTSGQGDRPSGNTEGGKVTASGAPPAGTDSATTPT
ncbi:anti-sigma-D factor RsdA [Pseudonocardia sp. TRM90224]|uniref:anti-sigma-D factor RsdA n=1 Tax=Pseudonocardia sp. TRM90224 TaxID=2812678 RepID=UPI001E47FD6B|nr:anti-sigma-D factor RsdA [Pseudonocardia sp. TRM90224]